MITYVGWEHIKIHTHAQPAYDAIVVLGRPVPAGIGVYAVRHDNELLLGVSGLGWFTNYEKTECCPVIIAPGKLPKREIERLAWSEAASYVTALTAIMENKGAYLRAIERGCPRHLHALFGLDVKKPSVADLAIRMEVPRDVYNPPFPPTIFERAVENVLMDSIEAIPDLSPHNQQLILSELRRRLGPIIRRKSERMDKVRDNRNWYDGL